MSPPAQDVPLDFPTRGVNLTAEASAQLPLTTPLGVNVRAQDPLARRVRGGSRTGLSRWVNARVNGVSPVQGLDVVVTADPVATLYCAEENAAGRVADPSTDATGRVPAGGRTVPAGGSGVMLLRTACGGFQVTTGASAASAGSASAAFPRRCAEGGTVLVGVTYDDVNTPTLSGITDSLGTSYSRVTRIGGNSGVGLFLDVWVGRLTRAGRNTVVAAVTAAGATPGLRLIAAEYHGVREASPVSATAGGIAQVFGQVSGIADSGTLVANQSADEVYAVFVSLPNVVADSGSSYTLKDGFTERARKYDAPPDASWLLTLADSVDPATVLADPVRPTLAWDSNGRLLDEQWLALAVALHS